MELGLATQLRESRDTFRFGLIGMIPVNIPIEIASFLFHFSFFFLSFFNNNYLYLYIVYIGGYELIYANFEACC